MLENKNSPYVCVPNNCINYWRKKLTAGDFTVAYSLVDFISEYENAIKLKQKYLTMKDIAEVLDIGYDAIRKVIPSLIKQNALCQYFINIQDDKYIKVYILNPTIAYVSDRLDDEFKQIFIDKNLVQENQALYSNNSERNTTEYKKWVLDSLIRDNYTCQCCGNKDNLEVHHILNYAQYKDLRTNLNNAITLCQCCHSPVVNGSFHNIYGTRNNTKEQLNEYIKNYNNKISK